MIELPNAQNSEIDLEAQKEPAVGRTRELEILGIVFDPHMSCGTYSGLIRINEKSLFF
jgi:hypothetical protein